MNPHYERGLLLFQRDRFEEAAAEFQAATAQAEDDPFIQGMLALCLSRLDRHQQALQAATRAVELAPNIDHGHYVLARVLTDRSRLAEAREAILRAIELAPDDASNHGMLARIEYEREHWQAALTAADAGLQQDAESDLCLHYRSLALAKLGRHAEAERDQETLLAADPEDPCTHVARGWTLLEQGRTAPAKEHFLEALRLDPSRPDARIGLANALKAQHFIFGVTLRFLLYLDRFRAWVVWIFIIGFFIGLRQLDRLGVAHPDLMVGIFFIKALFWSAIILIVVAQPLFGLVLRLDRDGRRTISPDQTRASNWHLVCLVTALALGLLWTWKGGILIRALAFATLMLTFAITNTYQASPGWVRTRMGWITIVAAVLIPLSYFGVLAYLFVAIKLKMDLGATVRIFLVYMPLISTLLSAFSDNIAGFLEQRRPDSSARFTPSLS
jgi:tetratricopeptide (TPR) repeat protein